MKIGRREECRQTTPSTLSLLAAVEMSRGWRMLRWRLVDGADYPGAVTRGQA